MSSERQARGDLVRPSTAVSAQYPTGCTACGAVVGAPCRSASGRVTDTHRARIDAQFDVPLDRPVCSCAPDCHERIACTETGVTHTMCGWCEDHGRARHLCGCISAATHRARCTHCDHTLPHAGSSWRESGACRRNEEGQ